MYLRRNPNQIVSCVDPFLGETAAAGDFLLRTMALFDDMVQLVPGNRSERAFGGAERVK